MAGDHREEPAGLAFFVKRKKGGFKPAFAPHPALEAPVADTHAHLDMLRNPALALVRSAVWGVGFICCVSDATDGAQAAYASLAGWRDDAQHLLDAWAANPAQVPVGGWAGADVAPETDDGQVAAFEGLGLLEGAKLPHVRMICGCHPHNAKDYTDDTHSQLKQLLADPRTCAVGEVGLDYHYDLSPRKVQQQVFARQVQLAHETGLALMLHLREAHDDAFDILQREGFPAGGTILHCFNLGPDEARRWLDCGCYLAVGGAVTFGSSDDLRQALHVIPRDRLLTETDSPYMAPAPMRGVECGPAHTVFTAARIAEELGAAPGEGRKQLLDALYRNAIDLLDRGPVPWQQDAR